MKETSSLDTTLVTLGSIMILLGAVMLMFLGMMTYMAITAPQDVAIVQFIIDHVRQGDEAFYGVITDKATGRKMEYKLEMSESVRSICFVFMGIGVMGVLGLILRVLVGAGVQLVRLASDRSN